MQDVREIHHSRQLPALSLSVCRVELGAFVSPIEQHMQVSFYAIASVLPDGVSRRLSRVPPSAGHLAAIQLHSACLCRPGLARGVLLVQTPERYL